jgi:hypothetical protein
MRLEHPVSRVVSPCTNAELSSDTSVVHPCKACALACATSLRIRMYTGSANIMAARKHNTATAAVTARVTPLEDLRGLRDMESRAGFMIATPETLLLLQRLGHWSYAGGTRGPSLPLLLVWTDIEQEMSRKISHRTVYRISKPLQGLME